MPLNNNIQHNKPGVPIWDDVNGNNSDNKIITLKKISNEMSKRLLETGSFIVFCSIKARREGLLALEEIYEDKLSKIDDHEMMKVMLRMIIDGTDAELIERYADNRIKTNPDNFLYPLIKEGMLRIQDGTNSRLIVLLMESLIPDNASYFPKDFRIKMEEAEEHSLKELESTLFD